MSASDYTIWSAGLLPNGRKSADATRRIKRHDLLGNARGPRWQGADLVIPWRDSRRSGPKAPHAGTLAESADSRLKGRIAVA